MFFSAMMRLACDGEMDSQPHVLCACAGAPEVLRDQPDERGHHASQAAHAEPYEPFESSDEPAGSDDTDVTIVVTTAMEVDNTTGDARPGWRPAGDDSDNDVIVTVDSTSDESDSSSSHWGTTSNPGPARVVARARATARVRQAANAPLARHLPGFEWQDLQSGRMSRHVQQPLVARDADGCGCGICIGADAASALANPAAGNAVARSFAEFPFPPPELNIDDGSGGFARLPTVVLIPMPTRLLPRCSTSRASTTMMVFRCGQRLRVWSRR